MRSAERLSDRLGAAIRGPRACASRLDPSHWAIAVGDAVVTTPEGELRMWSAREVDAARRRFVRERLVPTPAPLTDLPAERILVIHGATLT